MSMLTCQTIIDPDPAKHDAPDCYIVLNVHGTKYRTKQRPRLTAVLAQVDMIGAGQ